VTETIINVLAGLNEDEIGRLEAVCETQSVDAGDHVFTEGDEGDDLYIVLSGRVRISKAISLSIDRTLATLSGGSVFGELAMVGEGTRSATACAEEVTKLLVLSREGFMRLTDEEPVLGLKVMGRFAAALAERLRITTQLLTDTVKWGLEVSGAASLDLHHLLSVSARLGVALTNGQRIVGSLLKVEEASAGTLITILDLEGQIHMLPYHAVVSMSLNPTVNNSTEE
jgi:CRP/FNR family cyclic AMP-dependent transcriptional regulator